MMKFWPAVIVLIFFLTGSPILLLQALVLIIVPIFKTVKIPAPRTLPLIAGMRRLAWWTELLNIMNVLKLDMMSKAIVTLIALMMTMFQTQLQITKTHPVLTIKRRLKFAYKARE